LERKGFWKSLLQDGGDYQEYWTRISELLGAINKLGPNILTREEG